MWLHVRPHELILFIIIIIIIIFYSSFSLLLSFCWVTTHKKPFSFFDRYIALAQSKWKNKKKKEEDDDENKRRRDH